MNVLDKIKDVAVVLFHLAGLSIMTNAYNARFVNFAMKRPMNIKGEEEMHQYDGDVVLFNLKNKCDLAKAFLESQSDLTEEETEELKRIIAHRENILELKLKMLNPFNRMGKILRSRVNALSDPASNNVTHFKDGSSSFSIPGGSRNHYVTYEIQRKEINGQQEYFFVIHNRGSGRKTEEFHGTSSVTGENGLEYMRTSVSIKVDEKLLTPAFFSKLNRAGRASSIDAAYSVIKEELLEKGHGEILQSDLEKEYEKLNDNDPNKAALGKRLIEEDPSFHTVQYYGTCTESNRTAPEEKMASTVLRKKLKLFTLQSITCDACSSLFNCQSKINTMQEVFKKREAHLRAKIESNKRPKTEP